MTVFAPFATIADPLFSVRLAYATGIIPLDNGGEQRYATRVIPREEWVYLARTITAQSTGWLDSLAYGATDELFTVPYWPHGWYTGAEAAAGSSVAISVDATDRDFVNGGRAVLWRSENSHEEVTLSGVTGSTITAATLANTWAGGTFVMPAKRGRFTGNIDTVRLAAQMAEVPVTFAIEHGTDPGVSTPSTYAVFDVVPYIRRDVRHELAIQADRIENSTYTYADFTRRGTPLGARPFRVWLNSRAGVADLIAWFHGLKGRLTPFWLPTYQQDFAVVSGLGTTTLTITRCGYTTWMFPHESRRHLACVEPDGTVTHREVTAATDNGMSTGTETLTLDGTAPAATCLVSYLLLGRLASDTLEIRWRHSQMAECELGFVELPTEVTPRPVTGVGALTYTGLEPTVTVGSGSSPAPGVGALVYTGYPPTVAGLSIDAGLGELAYTGFAPTVASAGIIVGLGQVLYTGLRPLVSTGGTPLIEPGLGALTYDGFAPTV